MIESVNRKCRHLSHRLTRLLPHPQSRDNGTGDPIEARQLEARFEGRGIGEESRRDRVDFVVEKR